MDSAPEQPDPGRAADRVDRAAEDEGDRTELLPGDKSGPPMPRRDLPGQGGARAGGSPPAPEASDAARPASAAEAVKAEPSPGEGRPKAAPRILGGFRLIEKIAQGGMGVVYRGHQLALDRTVAVKVLSQRLASDEEFVKRLGLEAKAVAKLDHPNIVRAIDFGVSDGSYYFAMEFVDGESLADILDRRGKLPEVEALGFAIQVTRGLKCAWENEIVHRDIKPGNILITMDGTAKIADLGLVRELGAGGPTGLTQTGTIMGTPDYLAPEQAQGGSVDIRTDVYALGITLYEMVTGELPFKGDSAMEVIRARLKARPQPAYAVNPEVSEEFSGIIETMMAVDPAHRYPDPAVLLDDLVSVAEGGVPRYAVAIGSARAKVADAARARREREDTGPVPVVLRKRRRRRLAMAGGGAAAFVALVLLLAAVFGGGPRTDPLEEEAKTFFDRLVGLFKEGEFERLVVEADGDGKKYVGTALGGDIAGLRIEAEREVVKGRLFGDLVRQAREAVANGDHEGALRLLTEAMKLRHTTEVERLMERARSLARAKRHSELVRLARTALKGGDYEAVRQHLGDAKRLIDADQVAKLEADLRRLVKRDALVGDGAKAERAGDLAEAIRLYEEGLALGDDPALRERVRELGERSRLTRLLGEAEALSRKGDWARAMERLIEARGSLDFPGGGEKRKDVDARIEAARREQRYSSSMRSARDAFREEAWQKAEKHAGLALREKPGDRAATELMRKITESKPLADEITNSAGLELVLVPAGEFTMGTDAVDGGDEDERPARRVHVDAFYIGRHEVTNAQFEGMSPGHREKWKRYSGGDETPVVGVTWWEAQAFCQWLSRREPGASYRLPTEAEWEKAARGTDGRTYPWGSQAPDADGTCRCNFAPGRDSAHWRRDGFEFTAPADSFAGGRSPYGCHDMAGNVWEWCLDRYAKAGPGAAAASATAPGRTARPAYSAEADVPLTGAAKSGGSPKSEGAAREDAPRALRGGSFSTGRAALRSANRAAKPPSYYGVNVGFRVVRLIGRRAAEVGGGGPPRGEVKK